MDNAKSIERGIISAFASIELPLRTPPALEIPSACHDVSVSARAVAAALAAYGQWSMLGISIDVDAESDIP